MKANHRPRKVRADREREAKANRQRYRHWRDVLAEGTWIRCGRCGLRQYHTGILTRRECRRCGARLCEVGI
jgi:hypothetical protein